MKYVGFLGTLLMSTLVCGQSSKTNVPSKTSPASGGDFVGRYCLACHNDKLKTDGFSTASVSAILAGGNKYPNAVIPGDPVNSPLIKMLKGQIVPRMPMGKVLGDSEIAIVEQWISQLKPDPKLSAKKNDWLWPYQKPVQHEPPAVANAAWVANPIDAFILQKLEEKKIPPAPAAAKRVLARRVYFDLIGMQPSPDEMNAFLSDASPDGAAARGPRTRCGRNSSRD